MYQGPGASERGFVILRAMGITCTLRYGSGPVYVGLDKLCAVPVRPRAIAPKRVV